MTRENRTEIVISALNKTDQAFREVSGRLNDLGKSAGAIPGKFSAMSAGIGGAVLAVGVAVAGMVKTAIDAADELGKMAQKVGVTVEQLSALKYAGSLADVSMEQLGVGLKQLSKNTLAAAAGSKEQAGAFRALGIEIRDVDGNLKSNNDLVYELADRFVQLKDTNLKTAIAMKIFGKSGADLIPLLNSGSVGLKEMREEAASLGLILDEKTAKAAEQFNDNLTRLKSSASGLGYALAEELLPSLTRVTDQLVRAAKAQGGFSRLYEFTKAFLPDPNDDNAFPYEKTFGGTPWQPSKHVGSTLSGMMQGPASPLEQYQPSPSGPGFPGPRQVVISTAPGKTGPSAMERTLAEYLRLTESGTGKTGRSPRAGKTADSYDLNAAKREGGLYEWRDILEATDALSQFTAKLKAPELQQPLFNLGFTAVEFESLEAQQEKAAEAQRVQQEEMSLTEDSLRELARRYDETFGIKIPSAIEGTNMALVEYARMAADSTTQAFSAMYNALGGLEDALTDFVTTGKADFKGLIDSILKDVARMTIQKAVTGPLSNLLSNGLSSLFGGGSSSGYDPLWALKNAKGNAFASPDLSQYSGSVVTKPTFFKFAYGDALGVMGEGRDYEGIFPLARDKSGKLGVRAMGGGSSLTISIPLTVQGGDKKLASELRRDIEDLVERKVRDMA